MEEEIQKMKNTQVLSVCNNCNCMTYIMMDNDGNRFCGKCGGKK